MLVSPPAVSPTTSHASVASHHRYCTKPDGRSRPGPGTQRTHSSAELRTFSGMHDDAVIRMFVFRDGAHINWR